MRSAESEIFRCEKLIIKSIQPISDAGNAHLTSGIATLRHSCMSWLPLFNSIAVRLQVIANKDEDQYL